MSNKVYEDAFVECSRCGEVYKRSENLDICRNCGSILETKVRNTGYIYPAYKFNPRKGEEEY